jgi:hypothetical protein
MGIALLSSCKKEEIKNTKKPPYGGVITNDTLRNSAIDTLEGSTWLLYKWSNGFQSSNRSDTLYFINSFLYIYGNVRNQYELTTSGSQYSLVLEGTPIGDLSGLIPRNFVQYGELTNVPMKDVSNGQNGSTYQIWIKRIK